MSELRRALKKVGFTQAEFAREIGVSPQVVNNWIKRGYVPPRWVGKVAEATLGDVRKLCPIIQWPR